MTLQDIRQFLITLSILFNIYKEDATGRYTKPVSTADVLDGKPPEGK